MLPLVKNSLVTIFLCGDVMTGRGIDQVLPHPGDPQILESYMRDARGYVDLAEAANGPIPKPADYSYIWGDALAELDRMRPDVRIVNLETAVTRSGDYWPGKGINYRMHPANLPVLTVAGIDVASLANNHVLDWSYRGLTETLETLNKGGIKSAGSGQDLAEAQEPAVVELEGKGRVLVMAIGSTSSGIPRDWAATGRRPGVNLVKELSGKTLRQLKAAIRTVKKPGDVAVLSVHWGGNWGYEIPGEQRKFAHELIDNAGVDIVHGHSSHHVKGIEVYRERLILYGCGDFINDYEGIRGYEKFRGDLALMYFARIDPATGKLAGLEMTPTRVRRFQTNRAPREDALWLADILKREGKALGTSVELQEDNTLRLKWE
jgi:poly-gamma-glutamate synthesis protein (capsule biosynthesis protein)